MVIAICSFKVRYVDDLPEPDENEPCSLQSNKEVQSMKENITISGRKALIAFLKELLAEA